VLPRFFSSAANRRRFPLLDFFEPCVHVGVIHLLAPLQFAQVVCQSMKDLAYGVQLIFKRPRRSRLGKCLRVFVDRRITLFARGAVRRRAPARTS